MEDILIAIAVIFAIFSIILFWKIWIMTNNVRKMTNDVNQLKEHFIAPYAERTLTVIDEEEIKARKEEMDELRIKVAEKANRDEKRFMIISGIIVVVAIVVISVIQVL